MLRRPSLKGAISFCLLTAMFVCPLHGQGRATVRARIAIPGSGSDPLVAKGYTISLWPNPAGTRAFKTVPGSTLTDGYFTIDSVPLNTRYCLQAVLGTKIFSLADVEFHDGDRERTFKLGDGKCQ